MTGISAPAAKILGQNISIQGNGTEIVGGVEQGVDRIATEIIRRLEKERTLVVWAFDASGSLQAERERLVKHIDAIYGHIVQLDDKQRAADGGLLTMVEAFGNSRQQLLKTPTANRSDIIEAIKNVLLDTTGNELTFTTVSFLVRQWGRYKDEHRQNYRTMIIVVTDEVGDDDEHVEEAIKLAQSAGVPVYVLGSQAIFGAQSGASIMSTPRPRNSFLASKCVWGPKAQGSNRSNYRSGTAVRKTTCSSPALAPTP